jgi:chemotaxis protein methyltransferase CheR
LHELVKFERANLLDPAPAGPFDLILCRNVLLYFPKTNRAKLLARLASSLAPTGALMLGASETVTDGPPCFEPVIGARSLYRFKPAALDDLALTG